MKTREEILLDNVGSLKLSGLKWKSLNDRKELVHKAMQEYADQQLAEYKAKLTKKVNQLAMDDATIRQVILLINE